MKGCFVLESEPVNIHKLLAMENPVGLIGVPEQGIDISSMLPVEAREQGMMLLDVIYSQPQNPRKDPVTIFNRKGKALHTWPDGYIPGALEVHQICRELLR